MSKLFSIAYFPPVSYFAAMAQEMSGIGTRIKGDIGEISPSVVYIEACENYQKQSYRNRCLFCASEGVQPLSVPIVHEGGTYQLPIRSLKIDYSTPWVQQHKRAIVSAYRTSAYFEYYQDELFDILDAGAETLFELNFRLLQFFIEKTGLYVELRLTDDFAVPQRDASGRPLTTVYGEDYREIIHPKRPNDILARLQLNKPYFQVFAQKYGFQSDMSIMDLLFNEGPDSIVYLKNI